MLELTAYLDKKRKEVDEALEAHLPPADTRPASLHDAIRYSVFSGGKRIRPILCIAACAAVGGSEDKALPPAIAVELLHTYTLVHDDLPCMDDDRERRGKPTVHVAFGEAIAVLTGDALQCMAFGALAEVLPPHPYSASALISELAQAAGSTGVVGGQAEDIAAQAQTPKMETIEHIHLHKTADLFSCAIRMGAIVGGATNQQLAAATSYAIDLGVAFQITDDLLDADPSGHPGADDPANCLHILSPSEATEAAAARICQAKTALKDVGVSGTDPLSAIADFVARRNH